jgi:UDP-glucose 4-epimerase
MKNKCVLVTGGAGYIGSHMARLLAEQGFFVVVLDNLSLGCRESLPKKAAFVDGDLCFKSDIESLFRRYRFDAVMHLAALSVVSESVADPLKYYENNVSATLNLLEAMVEHKVMRFVFSSTAAIYGESGRAPARETNPASPRSPYGMSKLMVENALKDLSSAVPRFRYVTLRYFNACGAHPSGDLGPMKENETLLIPNILRAVRQGPKRPLNLFGDDYPTSDGTCIRDYVHVMDLCTAHLSALAYLDRGGKSGAFNLGSGRGYSVWQIIRMAERVLKTRVPVRILPRRPGDPARIVADASKAGRVLKWKPQFDLEAIVRTAWAWDIRRSGRKDK